MTHPFFSHPTVLKVMQPDVLEALKANQPPEGASMDEEIGHWIAVAAGAYQEIRILSQRLSDLEPGK